MKQIYRGVCNRCGTQLPTTSRRAKSTAGNKIKICKDCETNEVFRNLFKQWDHQILERKVNGRR
jgi:predicted SprT family Zn-dependent metalloprotease